MFNFFSKKREPQPLFFDTDIHCHIVPGIDDGSPDIETSVHLVEQMSKWGLKRIIASPHITVGSFENTPQTIREAFEPLQKAVKERGIPVELGYSAENRIDDLFIKNFSEGTLLTLPGNIILVENSFMQEPWNLDQMLFDLQVKGFRPVLVHPERYNYYYTKKGRYEAIHNAGTSFQVNLLSLAGYYGKDEKKIAERLIEKGLVEYIGTDLHRQGHVDAINSYLASKDYEKHRAALEGHILNSTI